MRTPFVSVLIDTYNHERFIEPAIVSVLEQDYPASEREIIVVDDGSTDRTPDIVRRFEPHVRYIHKANGGQASAFNVGIPECKGEIIAFLDGDDWWMTGKLQRVVKVLTENPGVGLVGHGIKECFADGTERLAAPTKNEKLRIASLETARVFRLRKCFLGTSRMTIRAGLVRQLVPVPKPLVIEADEYLFTLAAAMNEIVILHQPLTCYRVHGGNLFLAAALGAGMRRKQQVIATLAIELSKELAALGLSAETVNCVVEILHAEADQMRLTLDGGTPWETLRTENKIYGVLHSDAPSVHRLFRALTMIPAALLPPRWFYAGRRWLGKRAWYRSARAKALPSPEIANVAGAEEFKA
jgi:hypothetical protein